MTPRKLLLITTVPITLEAFLLPLAQHFRAEGWQVDALALGVSTSRRCQAHFDRLWDIQWSRNPLDPKNLKQAAPLIETIVAREGYDLVHVHTPVAAFVTRWALRSLRRQGRVKVIYTAHGFHFYQGGHPLKNLVFSTLERIAGRWTDHLIVINREDQQAAYDYQLVGGGLCEGLSGLSGPHRLTYMPGIGVDLDFYNPEAIAPSSIQALYTELQLPPDTPLILSIAEFIPRKRHADLLQGFAQMQSQTAHLLLAGEGEIKGEMQQLAIDLEIGDRVHFLGQRTDIPRLLRAARTLVLVSQQEGLPRCILEALALGTPVIGSRIRGTEDLLAQGGGILVELGDQAGLATALDDLVNHPDLAQTLGEQGRAQAQAYDLETIIEQHDRLYEQVLSGTEPFPPEVRPSSAPWQRSLKSGLERSLAALALVMLSPLMLVVAMAIALQMGTPVLFTQLRPGEQGRIFRLYKFRTMTAGAGDSGTQRITPLGTGLRRLSLDELPQLWNVVRGDMSLIGPRPLLVSYLPRYSPEQARRHAVKPGITGWAQVNGRNTLSWDEKFKLDIEYVDRWSLALDLKILYLTFVKVFRQEGINQGQEITMPEFMGSFER